MITLDIRRWNARHLVGASVAYWAGLAAATLTPFALAVASVARLGNNRGTASAAMNDGLITITALKDNVTVYTGSAHLLDVALWVAIPPLALWLVWVALRPNRAAATETYNALPDAARNGYASPQQRAGAPVDRTANRS